MTARRTEPPPGDVLAAALVPALGTVTIDGLTRLSGGASRETWRFDAVAGTGERTPLILRRDPPGRPSRPGGMTLEAAALCAANDAGLPVPEVVVDAEAPSPWATAGIVMRAVEGETLARRILRDDEYAVARRRLTGDCARFLAGLHALDPATIPGLPNGDAVAGLRDHLVSAGSTATPTFELAFRWLDAHRPPPRPPVVVHGDFRLGNLIVGAEGLRAALDWELVHTGSPVEDLGWLCTKAWRFGAAAPVGGFGTREELLGTYRDAGGVDVSLDELRWWEVQNTLKWGVMCIGQAAAHLSGAARSVELAAIGRRVCEQEWDLLLLLAPSATASQVPLARAADQPAPSVHGRPTATELLEAVEEFLRHDVITGTSGRLSFHARVAANVVAIVAREIAVTPGEAERRLGELAPLGVGSEADLAAAIARGDLDDVIDPLHDALAAGVAAKLAVANPRYPTQP